jgi:hypothetical protein
MSPTAIVLYSYFPCSGRYILYENRVIHMFKLNKGYTHLFTALRKSVVEGSLTNVHISPFTDFMKAYDSLRREVLYKVLTELGFPMKLVTLTKMCSN